MPYTSVVVGPPLSGKSSMVAAATLSAARYAAEGRALKRRPPEDSDHPNEAHGKPVTEVHRVTEINAGLWRPDETTSLETPDDLDDLAELLWLHWRRSVARSPEPRGFHTTVTEITEGLLGFTPGGARSSRLRFVEISSALFRTLGANKPFAPASAQGLACHRYQSAVAQADRLTLCLGATEQWSDADRAALRQVLLDYRRLRRSGARLTLVVNKADVWMAERAYRADRLAHEPDARTAEAHARSILHQRLHDDGLWGLISATPKLQMRIASNFGWLTASGSYNVDLAPLEAPLEPGPEPYCLRPLWPRHGSNPRHHLPSQPDTLRFWRPIGVVEALLGCEVPPARGHSAEAGARAGL